MKKCLFLITVLLLTGFSAAKGQAALLVLIFGEKAASENFYFSLKAGFNYSIISDVDEGKYRLGANFGLINNIRINDNWFLTPEFLPLSSRGVRDVPVELTGDPNLDELLKDINSSDRKLSYIDIPVLVRYHIGKRFRISSGPQFSYLTGAYDIYKSKPLDDIELTTELEITNVLNRWDVGAAIDLTYMVAEPKNGKGVNIYVRYTQGFIDMVKDNPGAGRFNSTIQLGAAFPFIETKPGE
jgi:hypothetical protein